MNPGQKVTTKYGPGTVIKREGSEGILAHRYLVLIDPFSPPKHLVKSLTKLQEMQGALAFFDNELKPII